MRPYLFIISFLLVSAISFSQVTAYEKGFKKGLADGYSYLQSRNGGLVKVKVPVAYPIPRIHESSQNFDDGYKRGFQVGLDAYRAENNNNASLGDAKSEFVYSQYVPPLNLGLLYSVLERKQKLYDSRFDWVQKRIYSLNDLNDYYFKNQFNIFHNEIIDIINNAVSSLNASDNDYTNDKVFESVENKLLFVEKEIATRNLKIKKIINEYRFKSVSVEPTTLYYLPSGLTSLYSKNAKVNYPKSDFLLAFPDGDYENKNLSFTSIAIFNEKTNEAYFVDLRLLKYTASQFMKVDQYLSFERVGIGNGLILGNENGLMGISSIIIKELNSTANVKGQPLVGGLRELSLFDKVFSNGFEVEVWLDTDNQIFYFLNSNERSGKVIGLDVFVADCIKLK